MRVALDTEFTARLLSPAGLHGVRLGARVEVPVTRAIVSRWRPATRDGALWEVTLETPVSQAPPGADPRFAAALAAGEFQLVWMDDGPVPAVQIFEPLFTISARASGEVSGWGAPAEAWPDPDDLAVMLRARTQDDDEGELDHWSEETRPTLAQVKKLIEHAAHQVAGELRTPVPESLWDQFEVPVRLLAACYIEQGYFPEQADPGQSARDQWWAMYERQMATLADSLLSRRAKALRLA